MTLLDEIGGEATLRILVEDFYDVIESHPLGREILALHQDGHGVRHSRIEQFNYLSGFLGGQKYYLEKYHHMNIKYMHEHVPIRMCDAQNWLKCMDIAIDKSKISKPARDKLRQALERVATVLVNQA
jgi:hemoglobin